MLQWLRSLFEVTPPKMTEEQMYAATTSSLVTVLHVCPTCLRSLNRHHFASYAVAAGKDDMMELLAAGKQCRWNDLRKLQTFIGSEDAFVAHAIRCTERSGTLINTLNPVELYEGTSLLRRYPLGVDEWLKLIEAAPDLEWHPF